MKKRIAIRLITLVFTIAIICSFGIVSNANGGVNISSGSITCETGYETSVPIDITSATGFWALNITVNYDRNNLEYTGYSTGAASSELDVMANEDSMDFVFSNSQMKDVIANGNLLMLNFKVPEGAVNGDYPITISVRQCLASNAEVIPATTSNGKIVVTDCLHPDVYWEITKEATCTENGLEERICKKCGKVVETRAIPAKHNWENDFTIDKQATCTENGEKSIHCKDCDERKEITAITANHSWNTEYTVIKKATCTQDGKQHIKCSKCDATKDEMTIPASHKWTEQYIIDKEATCTEDGEKSIHCLTCGERKNVTVIEAGHKFTEEIVSSLTLCEPAKDGKLATYYYTCAECGAISDNLIFESEEELPEDQIYKVTKGDKETIELDDEKDFVFTVEAPFSSFESFAVNGIKVSQINYSVTGNSQSTTITLKYSFLKDLAERNHSVQVSFEHGDAMLSFGVKGLTEEVKDTLSPPEEEKEEDTSIEEEKTSNFHMESLIIYILIIVSLTAVAFLVIFIVKKVKKDGSRYK